MTDVTKTHLSPDILTRYRTGMLAFPDDLLAVEAHLGACAACRNVLQTMIGGAGASLHRELTLANDAASPLLAHPNLLQLSRYASGQADATDREIVETHLEDCASCNTELARLNAPRPLPVSRRPAGAWLPAWFHSLSPREAWLVAGSATMAAITLTALLVSARDTASMDPSPGRQIASQQPSPSSVQNPAVSPDAAAASAAQQKRVQSLRGELAAAQQQLQRQNAAYAKQTQSLERDLQQEKAARRDVAQLEDQNQKLRRQLITALSVRPPLPPRPVPAPGNRAADEKQYAQVLEALGAVLNGKIPPLVGLSSGLQRSGDDDPVEGAAVPLVRPVATVVLGERAVLEAAPVEGATGYEVSVRDTSPAHQEVATIRLSPTKWQTKKALRRGQVYEWYVAARKDGQDINSPVAKFRVADAATASELARARNRPGASALELGFLYAQAGLLDEAAQQFNKLVQADPENALAQSLLSAVQRAAARTRQP